MRLKNKTNKSFLLGFAHEYFLLQQPTMTPDAEGSISMGKNNNNLDFMLLIVSEEESAGFGVLIPPQIKTIYIFARGFLNSKIHLL